VTTSIQFSEGTSVIVVLVPYKSPPSVLDTTREAVVLRVRDTSATGSYVASLPPGSLGLEFDDAWSALTKDMKTAKYFGTVKEALTYYESARDGLSLPEHARIIGALKRLSSGQRSCAPMNDLRSD
jgi:hypothetical protein